MVTVLCADGNAIGLGWSEFAEYTVKPHETLYQIATAHRMTVKDLTRVNPRTKTKPGKIVHLTAGQKLLIPTEAQELLWKHTLENNNETLASSFQKEIETFSGSEYVPAHFDY